MKYSAAPSGRGFQFSFKLYRHYVHRDLALAGLFETLPDRFERIQADILEVAPPQRWRQVVVNLAWSGQAGELQRAGARRGDLEAAFTRQHQQVVGFDPRVAHVAVREYPLNRAARGRRNVAIQVSRAGELHPELDFFVDPIVLLQW